jgi:hypothetical protein
MWNKIEGIFFQTTLLAIENFAEKGELPENYKNIQSSNLSMRISQCGPPLILLTINITILPEGLIAVISREAFPKVGC